MQHWKIVASLLPSFPSVVVLPWSLLLSPASIGVTAKEAFLFSSEFNRNGQQGSPCISRPCDYNCNQPKRKNILSLGSTSQQTGKGNPSLQLMQVSNQAMSFQIPRRSARKRTSWKLFSSVPSNSDNDENINTGRPDVTPSASVTKKPRNKSPKRREVKKEKQPKIRRRLKMESVDAYGATQEKTVTVRLVTPEKRKIKKDPNDKNPLLSPSSGDTKEAKNRIRKGSPPSRKKKAETARFILHSSDLAKISPQNLWIDLCVPPEELRPSATLTTGQCFNWFPVEGSMMNDDEEKFLTSSKRSAWGTHNATEWIGPLGNRIISVRETATTTLYRSVVGPTEDLEEFMRDYFQLDTALAPLYLDWAEHDDRLARIARVIPGVRILRQDPVECLFSFICSSNNNIPRITLMLSRMRETYGILLSELPQREVNDEGALQPVSTKTLSLYSFPTLDSLKGSTDEDFRQMGLGYRARYIVETRDLLLKLGGHQYLLNLRSHPDTNHVQDQLCQFSGIGKKVADCVALFSLDQCSAIPVDVHVQHIATRDYDATLLDGAKSLTPTIYKRVGDLFRNRFGKYAGWAHSLLFVAELPSFREVLPDDMVSEMDEWKEKETAKKAAEKKLKMERKAAAEAN